MLISLRHRFVFVANTKAASSAIEAALRPYAEIHHGGNPARKHIALHAALREYADLFARQGMAPEHVFKFGVMREPIDWIGSWFRYRKRPGARAPLPRNMSFAEFWQQGDWNFRRNARPNLQRDRFIAPDGTLLADAIIPYHALEAHFSAICARLGVQADLARRNVSRASAEAVRIPPWLRTELHEFYAQDYALFERLEDINAAGLARLAERASA